MNIGKEFFEKTKYAFLSEPDQKKGVPQPPLEQPVPGDVIPIPLPEPGSIKIPSMDIRQAIEQRTSLRRYTQTELSFEELSYLLWITQGVKSITDRPATTRTVPSAGSRHAFETFILINRVENLDPGLYRYCALKHFIYAVNMEAGINEELTTACKGQSHIRTSAATFFWAAEMDRMSWRYSERSYRYVLLDAGHVCQNFYLAAESIQCGVCAIAAYDDDLLNAALGVDGDSLVTVYAGTIGKR
jgi:SagB-type dehydrogenase family enzyme